MDSYHVLELVGEGSYGRVYRGRKRRSGQVVAMKFMPMRVRPEEELQSLKREIEILRGLRHPNIIQLLDSFETETDVVVVTEYAEGQLFQIIERDGSLPESRVREIACQLVSALYYLHSHRILHRDMKPQNILLEKSGMVKLCDFGFARAMSTSTLVLTSIKGTPLYMSPELVEGKPYDHTADLWGLGCILYELHTGAPPFYTTAIAHLVQIIPRDPIKWPDTMSNNCTDFLKGLLTKDPQKRLSWPELPHHPFIADGVVVLSDTSVFRPLTVTPSPDTLALKLQQMAEKTVATQGESRLLRKANERSRRKQKLKDEYATEITKIPAAAASPTIKPPFNDIAAVQSLIPKKQTRGQISIDYAREFPAVRPRQVIRHRGDNRLVLCLQDPDSEENWEKVIQESHPRQLRGNINYSVVLAQVKKKIQIFKAQLLGGTLRETCLILQPLKVLHNLILTPDLEKSHHIGCEVGLPHLLFDLVRDSVENRAFIQQPWSVSVLGEIVRVLLTYWEKHCDWMQTEDRLEELTKPFITILHQSSLNPLVSLTASVLCMFTHHDVSVDVSLDFLTSLLKNHLVNSHERQLAPPTRWGLCDGLLSLVLRSLAEHENVSASTIIDGGVFLDLWERIGTSLATLDTNFCSTNGMKDFLSTALVVFTKDPHLCVPLFSESESKCVYTLGRLLATDCQSLLADGGPERLEEDLRCSSLSVLCCHLLCFPFALDLTPLSMSRILQLYDTCGIIEGLLKVVQTHPPSLLELPVSLLSRLLLCDPNRSMASLSNAAGAYGFFCTPGDRQLKVSRDEAPQTRTASSLLQLDVQWDSALGLLTLLSQVARLSPQQACLQLYLEPSMLHQALTHPYDRIRAATCSLLGNMDPFRPTTPFALQPAIFKAMIDCLHDSSILVRRMSCRAVGSWLGHIAESWFKMSTSNGTGSEHTRRGREKDKNKHECGQTETGKDVVPGVKREANDEEWSRWIEEARRTADMLASHVTDPDALTRRHCCAALGNLVNVHGTVSLLLEEGVCGLLLKVACTDCDNAVRQAAIATLCLYTQRDAIRQVLLSIDASKKLVQAAQQAAPQCDYQQLIGQLEG
ncbi:serine/threonine-protein kinase 36 [Genypterus blacodes]|uniref:serine/threonine-protein kinase 36 n=1 Tax=Genypterus blacodes TaxID=154954 RepID=UPI003F76EAEE